MNRVTLSVVGALLLVLAGCSAASSGSGARPMTAATKAEAAFEKQLAAGRHTDVIAGVEARLPQTREPVERARLETLRARALLADGRARSAVLSFERAGRELGGRDPKVQSQILQGTGDAEMALEHWRLAIQQYTLALKVAGLTTRQKDDIAYSAYIAATRSGDSSAPGWRARVRSFSDERLAQLQRRLLPVADEPIAPAPGKLAAREGEIPDDPKLLLTEIRRRGEWGARAIKGDYDRMTPITRITVHHSGEAAAAGTSAAEAGELRQMQASHQSKWADLGYHFVIDPTGAIWEGRALKWQGAHEGVGLNQGSIGICLMGNFETQKLPAVQTAALARLMDSLCRHFDVDAAHIKTHREVRSEPTDCPGDTLQAWVDNYRRTASGRSLARQ